MTGDDGNPFKTEGGSVDNGFSGPSTSDNPFAGGGGDSTVSIPQPAAGADTKAETRETEPTKPPAKPSPAPAGDTNPFKPAANASSSGEGKPWHDKSHVCTEAELYEWEEQLKKRELAMGDYKAPNWPSWPKPCARIAIDDDIQDEAENTLVTMLYYCWFGNTPLPNSCPTVNLFGWCSERFCAILEFHLHVRLCGCQG